MVPASEDLKEAARLARSFVRKYRSYESHFDELEGAALIALVEARSKWDSAGMPFPMYRTQRAAWGVRNCARDLNLKKRGREIISEDGERLDLEQGADPTEALHAALDHRERVLVLDMKGGRGRAIWFAVQAGWSRKEVAIAAGVSRQRVDAIMQAGAPPAFSTASRVSGSMGAPVKERSVAIGELLKAGEKSPSEIARDFKVTRQFVRTIASRLGLSFRRKAA